MDGVGLFVYSADPCQEFYGRVLGGTYAGCVNRFSSRMLGSCFQAEELHCNCCTVSCWREFRQDMLNDRKLRSIAEQCSIFLENDCLASPWIAGGFFFSAR